MAYRPYTRIFTPAALTVAPVTLQAMKDHLRVTHDLENGDIEAQIMAATGAVERRTNRLLQSRSAVLRLTCMPSGQEPIELPGGVVSSITSVTVDGVAVTGATSVGDSPALLIPAEDWPTATGEGYPVVITYVVGYSTVPMALIYAVKLLVADLYSRRNNSDEVALHEVPLSAQSLIDDYRIRNAA